MSKALPRAPTAPVIELDDARDLVTLGEEVADFDGARVQYAVEGRRHHAVANLDLDPLGGRPRGLKVRARLGDVGLRLEVLALETFRGVVLDLALVHQGAGLFESRLQVAHVEAHDHVALLDLRPAPRADPDHPAVDLGAQGDAARRLGLAVDDHVAGHALGLHRLDAHAGDGGPIAARRLN